MRFSLWLEFLYCNVFSLTVASAKYICKIHFGSNDNVITLKPRFTHTRLIRTPRYFGEFPLSPGKESPVIFSKFNPLNTDTPLIRPPMAPSVSVYIKRLWLYLLILIVPCRSSLCIDSHWCHCKWMNCFLVKCRRLWTLVTPRQTRIICHVKYEIIVR